MVPNVAVRFFAKLDSCPERPILIACCVSVLARAARGADFRTARDRYIEAGAHETAVLR